MGIGNRLSKLRKELELTQQQVADEIKVSRPTIGKYETEKAYPDFQNLVALANLYNCSTDYLLGLIDTPRRISSNENTFIQELFALAVSEELIQNNRPITKDDYNKLLDDLKTSFIAIKLLKRINPIK